MSQQIPGFLQKLFFVLNEAKHEEYITWSANGKSFIIKDPSNFSKLVLPLYYKHNKLSSFIRQLNLYGFQKVSTFTEENSAFHVMHDSIEFQHCCFIRNQHDLLSSIKRKSTQHKKQEVNDIAKNCCISNEIQDLKSSQAKTNKSITSLQQENDYLWREVISLRQKHSRQQNVINHLIKFLLNIAKHPQRGLKRNLPLMIEETNEENLQPHNKVAHQTMSTASNLKLLQEGVSRLKSSETLITEIPPVNNNSCADDVLSSASNVKESISNIEDQSISPNLMCTSTKDQSSDEFNLLLNNQNFSSQAEKKDGDFFTEASNASLDSAIDLTSPSYLFSPPQDNSNFDSIFNTNQATFTNSSDVTSCSSNPHSSTSSIHVNADQKRSSLEDLKERLSNNELIHLDYDLIQELFYGSVDLMPQPSMLDDSFGFHKNVPGEGNELVQYNSASNNSEQVDFSEILDLLKD